LGVFTQLGSFSPFHAGTERFIAAMVRLSRVQCQAKATVTGSRSCRVRCGCAGSVPRQLVIQECDAAHGNLRGRRARQLQQQSDISRSSFKNAHLKPDMVRSGNARDCPATHATGIAVTKRLCRVRCHSPHIAKCNPHQNHYQGRVANIRRSLVNWSEFSSGMRWPASW